MLDFRLFCNTGTYTGTSQHVCTLPDAWRPAETTTCAIVAMDSGTGMGVGHLTVKADGTVSASTTFPGARWAIGSIAYLR